MTDKQVLKKLESMVNDPVSQSIGLTKNILGENSRAFTSTGKLGHIYTVISDHQDTRIVKVRQYDPYKEFSYKTIYTDPSFDQLTVIGPILEKYKFTLENMNLGLVFKTKCCGFLISKNGREDGNINASALAGMFPENLKPTRTVGHWVASELDEETLRTFLTSLGMKESITK